MNTNFDGTATNGRKGIAYDWQSLLPEYAVTDEQLVELTASSVEVAAS